MKRPWAHTSVNANWSVISSIGFAASVEDATGLVYMEHRFYDTVSARAFS
jgi:hypothetical protein